MKVDFTRWFLNDIF